MILADKIYQISAGQCRDPNILHIRVHDGGLECLIKKGWNLDQEIRWRIEQAKTTFQDFENLLETVLSVLLYGVKTLKASIMDKIEAFEIWIFRPLLRVIWADDVRDKNVLRSGRHVTPTPSAWRTSLPLSAPYS